MCNERCGCNRFNGFEGRGRGERCERCERCNRCNRCEWREEEEEWRGEDALREAAEISRRLLRDRRCENCCARQFVRCIHRCDRCDRRNWD